MTDRRVRWDCLAGTALCLLLCLPVRAAPLLQTTTSWDGGSLAYPDGEVQITSRILHLEPGQRPPFHCHPVPTMGYVLRGTIEVTTGDGTTARFEAGQSTVEVMNTAHRGIAIGGPVDIIVFFAGAKGLPNTITPDGDEHGRCQVTSPTRQD